MDEEIKIHEIVGSFGNETGEESQASTHTNRSEMRLNKSDNNDKQKTNSLFGCDVQEYSKQKSVLQPKRNLEKIFNTQEIEEMHQERENYKK